VSSGRSMSLDSAKPKAVDAAPLRIAVAAARYNERLVEVLLERVVTGLRAGGITTRNLTLERVPGSNELPVAARLIAGRRKPDAIVALGVIIRGDTLHYELIATAVADALQQVALSTQIPVINGIVVAESQAQAEERCMGRIDRGLEFAQAAIAMAALKRRLAR
jgi:6,7-dimethyl-8-ribityllumazine synthase